MSQMNEILKEPKTKNIWSIDTKLLMEKWISLNRFLCFYDYPDVIYNEGLKHLKIVLLKNL